MPFDPAAALVALDTVLAGLTTLTLGYLFYVCTREGAFEPQKGNDSHEWPGGAKLARALDPAWYGLNRQSNWF